MGRLLTASSPWHRTVSAGSSADGGARRGEQRGAVARGHAARAAVQLLHAIGAHAHARLVHAEAHGRRGARDEVQRRQRAERLRLHGGPCTPCDDAMHTLTSPSSAVHSVAAGTRLAPVSPAIARGHEAPHLAAVQLDAVFERRSADALAHLARVRATPTHEAQRARCHGQLESAHRSSSASGPRRSDRPRSPRVKSGTSRARCAASVAK